MPADLRLGLAQPRARVAGRLRVLAQPVGRVFLMLRVGRHHVAYWPEGGQRSAQRRIELHGRVHPQRAVGKPHHRHLAADVGALEPGQAREEGPLGEPYVVVDLREDGSLWIGPRDVAVAPVRRRRPTQRHQRLRQLQGRLRTPLAIAEERRGRRADQRPHDGEEREVERDAHVHLLAWGRGRGARSPPSLQAQGAASTGFGAHCKAVARTPRGPR
mmetsp:Transcript_2594/g.8613  ORF Transcript_2594/g.8613 Transcript_2594/m.8613 type:complete len:216 (-) Transcript_2594:992-1639(-)